MGKKPEITETLTVDELIKHYPRSAKILKEKGLDCVPCSGRIHETLRQAARMHGLDPGELVRELKKALDSRKGS